MYDTIVIGAGLSGLAAGIRLALQGLRVCIVERHYTIGGLNSFYRLRGHDYDVGLHAITNYAPKGTRKGPLASLLRRLRLSWEDFALRPQLRSKVTFGGATLHFNNDVRHLEEQIRGLFPGQVDNFRRLQSSVADYAVVDQPQYSHSARKILGGLISDRLLAEMILCPLMWYGNARERDMDWGQFSILFRSVFLEGLARPYRGIRPILKALVRKYREFGGEMRLRCGVQRIQVDGGKATGVVLDDGSELDSRKVVSSAGWLETMRMCGRENGNSTSDAGVLSFVEAISVLDRRPKDIGFDQTNVFFNDGDQFHWEKPSEELCDVRSGVICCPDNFDYQEPETNRRAGMIRITALADYGRWTGLAEEDYRVAKLRWYDRLASAAADYVPDFRSSVIDTDVFTPKTIKRFTGHHNGAVYGASTKRLDGRTDVDGLYICGTDQGLLGIVGSMISGVTVVNRHCLGSP